MAYLVVLEIILQAFTGYVNRDRLSVEYVTLTPVFGLFARGQTHKRMAIREGFIVKGQLGQPRDEPYIWQ
jgi:hypothetical protein